MHISNAVGLAERTSNRTTHSLRAFVCIPRQMVMRSDYWQICRRWLSSLSGTIRLQTLNWSLVTSSVWRANLTNGFSRWICDTFERLSSRRQWHLVESSSVTMKGTKGRMNTTFAHCLMRMDGNVVNVGRRHERSLHINVTHRGENAWRNKGSGKPGGHKSVFLVRIDSCASMEITSKHMAAAERHNRCVVDAGRFHYPVIDIPDTICPRCDLIFKDTAELQRHHGISYSRVSFISAQCRNLCRCL